MRSSRFIIAVAAFVVVLVVASLFAAMSRCGALNDAARKHRRRLVLATGVVVVVAIAWLVLSPLAAAAVPLLFAAGVATRTVFRGPELVEYADASDRARSEEPPWWPEFEREFRRETRRRQRAARRSGCPRDARRRDVRRGL